MPRGTSIIFVLKIAWVVVVVVVVWANIGPHYPRGQFVDI